MSRDPTTEAGVGKQLDLIDEHKACARCQEEHPLSEFRSQGKRLRSYCRTCEKIKRAEYRYPDGRVCRACKRRCSPLDFGPGEQKCPECRGKQRPIVARLEKMTCSRCGKKRRGAIPGSAMCAPCRNAWQRERKSPHCECGNKKSSKAISCKDCAFLDGVTAPQIEVLDYLLDTDEATVTQIADYRGGYWSATQRTLRHLEKQGRVVSRKADEWEAGKNGHRPTYYRLAWARDTVQSRAPVD